MQNQRVDSIVKKKRLTMRTIHRSCHSCPFPKPPPPPSGDSRDPPPGASQFSPSPGEGALERGVVTPPPPPPPSNASLGRG